ncbi:MAG: hypothetical protein JO056_10335 [Alphaproteobacteria bacterium]|nr:hypothetical protein [Alphaproteobacteria bacterium]
MRLSIAVLCAALLAPVATAYSGPPPTRAAQAHFRGGLTPEERYLYRKQIHGADWRKLSLAQRCERAKMLRQQRRSMSAADLRNLKQRLDAQWNRLPAAEKRRIEQRLARHQEHKAAARSRSRGHRCANIDPAD